MFDFAHLWWISALLDVWKITLCYNVSDTKTTYKLQQGWNLYNKDIDLYLAHISCFTLLTYMYIAQQLWNVQYSSSNWNLTQVSLVLWLLLHWHMDHILILIYFTGLWLMLLYFTFSDLWNKLKSSEILLLPCPALSFYNWLLIHYSRWR